MLKARKLLMDLQPSSMPQPWNLLQIKTSQLQQGLSFLPPCTSPAAVATPAAAAAQQTFPSDLRSDPAQPCRPLLCALPCSQVNQQQLQQQQPRSSLPPPYARSSSSKHSRIAARSAQQLLQPPLREPMAETLSDSLPLRQLSRSSSAAAQHPNLQQHPDVPNAQTSEPSIAATPATADPARVPSLAVCSPGRVPPWTDPFLRRETCARQRSCPPGCECLLFPSLFIYQNICVLIICNHD